ncbi:hypothetical protein WG907_08720 [Sphingobium sp. AN558]|uniref:hypothetical protein n=1 Tax=Sphingobium sp. AN558 TaxID=3133442 RepID=UPI0030C6487D
MRFRSALLLFLLAACRAEPDHQDDPPDPAPVAVQPPPDNAIVPARPLNHPHASAPSPDLVPATLQGRWTGVRDDCSDKAAAMELEITPARLIFHESVGIVTAARSKSDGSVELNADFTGEGASWTRRLLLQVSPDGRRLTITNDGTADIRQRCDAP